MIKKDSAQLAELFKELAVLQELAGENPFKIRAIESAARTLENTDISLESLVASPPKGFGKGLIERVEEFRRTGRLQELDNLRASFPAGVLEMLRVQGLGPKKVKLLYEELKIDSIESLEMACKQGKLLTLKGFGEKSQANILHGISLMRQFQGLFMFDQAEEQAHRLLAFMKNRLGSDLQIEIAGSLRRHKELVKDIDLLVASDGAEAVMTTFLSWPDKIKVIAEGKTKSSILLPNGLQVDLRVVPPESFGPALCHFTGSKEHNAKLRSIALDKGYKLNEYGLYKNEKTTPLASEEEVYAALGLCWVAPELREGFDELEWAAADTLPILIEESDIKGLLHAHTTFSDGHATVEQMADAARSLGLNWLGLSDHSKSAYYANGLEVDRLQEQWEIIDRFNAKHTDFRILKGIESDILPDGNLDYPKDVLEKFDFVIASIHSQMSMPADAMTKRVLRAIENPFTSVLGHPTCRLLLERNEIDIDLDAILQACVRLGVIVEINANPHRLDLDWRKIRAWRNSGLKFVIGPDAHSTDGLRHFRYGVGIARKGGLTREHLLNCLDVDSAEALLQARRHNCRILHNTK